MCSRAGSASSRSYVNVEQSMPGDVIDRNPGMAANAQFVLIHIHSSDLSELLQ